jgi:hypothetical protein
VPNNGSTTNSNSAVTCGDSQEKMLSVSGKKKCSHCGEELGKFPSDPKLKFILWEKALISFCCIQTHMNQPEKKSTEAENQITQQYVISTLQNINILYTFFIHNTYIAPTDTVD